MKISTTIIKGLLFGLLTFCFTSGFSQTADTLADLQTKCILQYISGLSSQPNNKVISGQWMHHRYLPETPQTEFDTAITSIYNQTSKWVGIIGTDYMRDMQWPNPRQVTNLQAVNQPLINHFNQGGLVTIMVSLNNPWNGGSQNNTTGASNLLDVITTTHPANIQFVKDLDSIALGIQQLQDSGVTVIFRPLHENNGTWFWWGYKPTHPPADFIAVWQYMFNYFTTTKQLHNILWMFCPSVKETGDVFRDELFYYPGNNYVDFIGLDEYNDTLDIDMTRYLGMLATGKPIGFAEFGPEKINVTNNPFVYDYTTLINQIRNKYPELSFFHSWNHFFNGNAWVYFSLSTQNNTDSLLNDSWVVNRNEIDYSACLITSIDESTTNDNSVIIFPNPFSSQTVLRVENILKNATLTIYNSFGQTVKEIKNISGQTVSLHRDNLPSGLYFICLTQENKEIITKKIIIKD